MVLSFDVSYAAWRKTVELFSEQENKARFKYNIVPNLFKIKNEFNDGTFKPGKLRTQIVYFPKKRIVQVPSIRDKVLQHRICDNYLTERLTKPIICQRLLLILLSLLLKRLVLASKNEVQIMLLISLRTNLEVTIELMVQISTFLSAISKVTLHLFLIVELKSSSIDT